MCIHIKRTRYCHDNPLYSTEHPYSGQSARFLPVPLTYIFETRLYSTVSLNMSIAQRERSRQGTCNRPVHCLLLSLAQKTSYLAQSVPRYSTYWTGDIPAIHLRLRIPVGSLHEESSSSHSCFFPPSILGQTFWSKNSFSLETNIGLTTVWTLLCPIPSINRGRARAFGCSASYIRSEWLNGTIWSAVPCTRQRGDSIDGA
jgi:hypothetical protein